MVGQGSGKVINVALMLSFQGGVFIPAYTATEYVLAGMTKAFANEWAGPEAARIPPATWPRTTPRRRGPTTSGTCTGLSFGSTGNG